MPQSAILSRAQVGLDAPIVTVETHLSGGLPGFTMVGLPATAVREARDRVRSAIVNCGFKFPKGRVVVNLAPGDLTKEGPRYDLAIAASILCATGQIPTAAAQRFEYLGELSLDGTLRSVRGAFCAALTLAGLHQQPARSMILPAADADVASALGNNSFLGLPHLGDLRQLLGEPQRFQRSQLNTAKPELSGLSRHPSLAQIIGQEAAKRALLVAAAGGHHLLMVGPPGTGKTMLARALAGLLPPLSHDEWVEVAAVYSAAGSHFEGRCPPFREPHHSSSATALIGGGTWPQPGEVSMAHRGVLFLDELPHFNSNVLDLLREPLGDGAVTVARAKYRVQFPARFQLLAAMNPCPAGLQCTLARCRCSGQKVRNYQARISGPLLDRIDLQVAVPPVPQTLLLAQTRTRTKTSQPTSSELISGADASAEQLLVQATRERQFARQGSLNAEVGYLEDRSEMTAQAQQLLQTIAQQRPLSARAYHRLLKVARTIADLADADAIDAPHVGEAFSLRHLDWENSLGLPG